MSKENKNKKITFYDILKSKLTPEEEEIMKIQRFLSAVGWQWKEQIYNDLYKDCYLEISKKTDPTTFLNGNGDAGWGRFGRLSCWRRALEWVEQH